MADEASLKNCRDIKILGRFSDGSNATLLVEANCDDEEFLCIYKPLKGERPLWDFEPGIFKREIAAYELSKKLGFCNIPATILREDLEFGIGSLQLYIESDRQYHYFNLLEKKEFHESFIEIAVFDLIANNADRKAGHTLLGSDGKIWSIDHGLCFHECYKLRTVIWDFEGYSIPHRLIESLKTELKTGFRYLKDYLGENEINALISRVKSVISNPMLPYASNLRRQIPWPLI
jgi:uncharacterized repeat protein (TIGR03843 family)